MIDKLLDRNDRRWSGGGGDRKDNSKLMIDKLLDRSDCRGSD
jgi:hypothetical protein